MKLISHVYSLLISGDPRNHSEEWFLVCAVEELAIESK